MPYVTANDIIANNLLSASLDLKPSFKLSSATRKTSQNL